MNHDPLINKKLKEEIAKLQEELHKVKEEKATLQKQVDEIPDMKFEMGELKTEVHNVKVANEEALERIDDLEDQQSEDFQELVEGVAKFAELIGYLPQPLCELYRKQSWHQYSFDCPEFRSKKDTKRKDQKALLIFFRSKS